MTKLLPVLSLSLLACGADSDPVQPPATGGGGAQQAEDGAGGGAGDADARGGGPQAPADGGDAVDDPAPPVSTETYALSGTFAVKADVNAKLIIDLTSIQYFLMEFEDAGDGQLKQTTTNCRNDLPSVEGVAEMVLPPPVLDLLQSRPMSVTGHFAEDNVYAPPAQAFSLGVDFEGRDPFTATLPTEDDLTHALDEDGDGHPGVTVDVEALLCGQTQHVYAAFRTVVELAGTIDSEELITGTVVPVLDQAILGVSDDCLNAAKALEPEVAEGSTFRAVRIDPGVGAVTCDDMLADVDTLFPAAQ